MINVRRRFWVTAGVAVASVALFVVTVITPDWIEAVFRVDPDGGSGAVEWLIAAGLGLVAAATCAVSVAEWRHTPAEVAS
jgi:hypothetical protein